MLIPKVRQIFSVPMVCAVNIHSLMYIPKYAAIDKARKAAKAPVQPKKLKRGEKSDRGSKNVSFIAYF